MSGRGCLFGLFFLLALLYGGVMDGLPEPYFTIGAISILAVGGIAVIWPNNNEVTNG